MDLTDREVLTQLRTKRVRLLLELGKPRIAVDNISHAYFLLILNYHIMNIDSRGLFYGGAGLLIAGYLLFTFTKWLFIPEPTRKFRAVIKAYNYETKQWEEQYGQALIKGDKQLVGFLAVDGIR